MHITYNTEAAGFLTVSTHTHTQKKKKKKKKKKKRESKIPMNSKENAFQHNNGTKSLRILNMDIQGAEALFTTETEGNEAKENNRQSRMLVT